MAKRLRDGRVLVDTNSASWKLDEHPNKLLEGLNRLRLNKVFCDVILCCEGQEFPCHRVVLASISSYFQAMFTSGMMESTQERVNMDGVEPEVVHMLLSFAYTSEVSISTANVQVLLAGANLMDVPDVREACCQFMYRHMNINNCVEINLLAEQYSCQELEKCSMDYILEYFSVLYKQEAFLSLCVDKVTEILSSDHLNVPEEDMVFDAAILWLNTCTDRRQTADKVLESIRVPLLSPSYLHTVMESLDEMKESQGCQSFLSEAQTYQRLLCEAEDPQTYQRLLSESEDPQTYQRLLSESEDPQTYQRLLSEAEDPQTYQRLLSESEDPQTYQRLLSESEVPQTYQRLRSESEDPQTYQRLLSESEDPQTYQRLLSESEDPQTYQRLLSEAEDQHLLSYRDTAPPRRTTVIVTVGRGGVTSFDAVECFDPRSKQWRDMEYLRTGGKGPSIVASAIGSFLYEAGGRNRDGSFSKELWRCDLHRLKWSKMAAMNQARCDCGLVMVDMYVFALGGLGQNPCRERSVERFDPDSNTWRLMKSVNTPDCDYRDTAMVGLEGIIYVFGGVRPHNDQLTSESSRYDPRSGEWTDISPARILRAGCAACALNGKIYVIGGMVPPQRVEALRGLTGGYTTKTTAVVECYDPRGDQWTTCAPMQRKRLAPSLAVMDGMIYVLGGGEDTHSSGVRPMERYREDRNEWQSAGQMPDQYCGRFSPSWMSVRLRSDARTAPRKEAKAFPTSSIIPEDVPGLFF